MNPLIECVPNFSEGRDEAKMEKIAACFRNRPGVRLIDRQRDADHNRLVLTVLGEPEATAAAVLEAMAAAVELIDLRFHRGQHPRMGAVDVVPFVPIPPAEMETAVALSRRVAAEAAGRFGLPVFLYEASATRPERRNLADIRRGEFEGMAEKLKEPEWQPDFGPPRVHPTAGVTAVGARKPLVAFNVILATEDIGVAKAVAGRVRHSGGGLRYCKAIGVEMPGRGRVQVAINLTDFTRTALYQAFEMVRTEARRYGVSVAGSEIVGTLPMAALIDSALYYLGVEGFHPDQVLETHLLEGRGGEKGSP